MRIIRHADCRPMPWKNGGGVTTEIMAWPPEAGLDDFDWRISMAQVASGGPFSTFAGIDRTLTVLSGAMLLAVGEAEPVALSQRSAPFSFPGDVATSAELVAGPVTDLNVMTRRGKLHHSVQRLDGRVAAGISLRDGINLLFCASGSARFSAAGEAFSLFPFDTLFVDRVPAGLSVESAGSTMLRISIVRA